MNFIAQVEENLRDLGTEARKKHPGVKEASERAILTLRSLQTQYVSAVRAASSNKSPTPTNHPTTSLFRSQDVLRPFLLACNYPDASFKLLNIALNAIQLLISGDAVCPSDAVNIVRVLAIQSCASSPASNSQQHSLEDGSKGSVGGSGSSGGVGMNLPQSVMLGIVSVTGYSSSGSSNALSHRSHKEEELILGKVLQTLTVVIESRSLELGEEVLSQSLLVCMAMIGSGNNHSHNIKPTKLKLTRSASAGNNPPLGSNNTSKIRRLAIKTLKKIICLVFERVAEIKTKNNEKKAGSPNMAATRLAASRLFCDLCILAENRTKSDHYNEPKSYVTGPFSTSLGTAPSNTRHRSIGPPPRSFSFECIQLVVSQQPFLFEQKYQRSQQKLYKDDVNFFHLLKNKACPLLVNFLLCDCCSLESKKRNEQGGTLTTINKKLSNVDFCLLVRCIMLACTIIKQFDMSEGQEYNGECQILTMGLVKFITHSVDSYRDSDSFKDNFIFKEMIQYTHDSLLSNHLLWRASLSLESLLSILSANQDRVNHLHNSSDMKKTDGSTTIALITESVSDFATISTSNRNGILSLVQVIENELEQKNENAQEKIFGKAVESSEWYEEWDSNVNNEFNKAISVEHPYPKCDEGITIWAAFKCVFTISKAVSSYSKTDLSLVVSIFAPSLALYVHYLRRFPGSKVIVQVSLEGLLALANASIPIHDETQCKALLTSLCKIILDSKVNSNGSTDVTNNNPISSTMQHFRDHQVEVLSCLFCIIHTHYNDISSGWTIFVITLDHLSRMQIASPYTSQEMVETCVALSSAMTRLSAFSTCFTADVLRKFLETCADIALNMLKKPDDIGITSKASSEQQFISNGSQESFGDEDVININSQNSPAQQQTFGNKLFNFAGRAFSGTSSTVNEHDEQSISGNMKSSRPAHNQLPQPPQSKKKFGEDSCSSIFSHIAKLTKTSSAASTTGKGKELQKLIPYSLLLLIDCSLLNFSRFFHYGANVIEQLCVIAAASAEVRQFVIDILCHLILLNISGNNTLKELEGIPAGKKRLAKTNPSPEDYFVFDDVKIEERETPKPQRDIAQEKLIQPLCQSIAETEDKDFALVGLNALYVILEGVGQNLTGEVWLRMIYAITSLSGCSSDHSQLCKVNRTGPIWSSCSSFAFRCLKLIVDDFLGHLLQHEESSEGELSSSREALLDCCAAFGSSKHDVNTSLTAIGMLWTIADQDSNLFALDHVFSKLSDLACDNRPEVRNCSVNTLYSCIVGVGHRFTQKQWRSCFEKTVFGVFDLIASKGNRSPPPTFTANSSSSETENKPESSRYTVAVHHSRDSENKLWATTQVLALRGLERVLRQFFNLLLCTTTFTEPASPSSKNKENYTKSGIGLWFDESWSRIVQMSKECASQAGGRESLELRLAGVDLLVLCTQLSCRDGVAALPVRVGTNMQVINGALRQVPSKKSSTNATGPQTTSSNDENEEISLEAKHQLFVQSFETLEAFTMELNNEGEEDELDHMFIETVRLQVLTKVANGLTKLYDCCKDYELSSDLKDKVYSNKSYEARFVNMVHSITILAVSEKKSKYLTQAQRISLELLRKMATSASAKAFEKLAVMGGKYFTWFPSSSEEKDDSSIHDDSSAIELIEQEAAKAVSEAFVEDSVPDVVKTSVLNMILRRAYSEPHKDSKILNKVSSTSSPTFTDDVDNLSSKSDEFDGSTSYDFLVPIVTGGLKAASNLEKSCYRSSSPLASTSGYSSEDIQEVKLLLNSLWNRVFCMLNLLLSPDNNTYTPHTDQILQIMMYCVSFVSSRYYNDLSKVLYDGCNKAIEVAKLFSFYSNSSIISTGSNRSIQQNEQEISACKDAIRIFDACFVGLLQCGHNNEKLCSISEVVLTNAIEDIERRNKMKKKSYTSTFQEFRKLIKDESGQSAKSTSKRSVEYTKQDTSDMVEVEIELAISVCDTLGASSIDLINVTLKLFPQLCRLINANDDRLSSKAGIVLSNLDLAGIVSRATAETVDVKNRLKEAEQEKNKLEAEILELKALNKNLQQKLESSETQ